MIFAMLCTVLATNTMNGGTLEQVSFPATIECSKHVCSTSMGDEFRTANWTENGYVIIKGDDVIISIKDGKVKAIFDRSVGLQVTCEGAPREYLANNEK